MPRGNKTGPNGNGPMTGRGLGYCNGNNQPGFLNDDYTGSFRGHGRGFGFRRGGRGLGYGRHNAYATDYLNNNYDVSEKTLIENQINVLKDKLSALEEKLKNLDIKAKKKATLIILKNKLEFITENLKNILINFRKTAMLEIKIAA